MGSGDRSTFNSTRKSVKLSNDRVSSATNSPANFTAVSSTANYIGNLGENLVSQWLEAQGWEILHRRWRCRYGEIDAIAIAGGDGEMGSRGDGERGIGSQLPITNYQLPITNYQSPITNFNLCRG